MKLKFSNKHFGFQTKRYLVGILSLTLGLTGLVLEPANAAIDLAKRDSSVPEIQVLSTLSFPEHDLELAKQSQLYLKSLIQKDLDRARQAGAIRIERITHKGNPVHWKGLVNTGDQYTQNGIDAFGKVVYRGSIPLRTWNSLQVRTVFLSQKDCSLDGVNLALPNTWFISKCSIETQAPQVFLRSALQSWIDNQERRPAVSSLQDILNYIVSKKISFKISGGNFICLGCTINDSYYQSFPMKYDLGFQPYKITTNANRSKFKVTILNPNYPDVLANAFVSQGFIIHFEGPNIDKYFVPTRMCSPSCVLNPKS